MRTKLIDAPMAVASDGSVLASVTHLTGERADPQRALEHALRSGRRVFVGVELSTAEASMTTARLDDALAEIVSLVGYRERG